jgi:alpha-L-glutamate ligase-like protein
MSRLPWPRILSLDVLGINRRNLDHVFADYRPGKFRPLDDKLQTKSRLEAHGIATPTTICVIPSRAAMATLRACLAERTELVIKPSRGWGGRGILVLERDAAGWRSAGGRRLDVEEIIDHATEILIGAFSLDEAEDAVLVETRIVPHGFQARLYAHGLSDLRVVLNRGEPIQAMLRVPTDQSDGKANLHEGGIGLGVDLESGRVSRAIHRGERIHVHPDTGVELDDLQVPQWAECLEQARRAARAFAEIDYLGVDIVIDAEGGPLVLEVNARPGLAIQLANGKAQPVEPPPSAGFLERAAVSMSWLVLFALATAPLIFDQWRQQLTLQIETVAVRPSSGALAADDTDEEAGIEWSEASFSLSTTNQRFAEAKLAAERGEPSEALELYRLATADPTVAPFALNNMALIHRERGELSRAEELLHDAVERLPEYARGHYNLALVQRDLGHRDAAIATLRTVVQRQPSYGRAWGELGELTLGAGRPDEAIAHLEAAIRFEPTLVSYRRALGMACLAAALPGRAAAAYGQALALSPESRSASAGWVESRLQLAAATLAAPSASSLDSINALLPRLQRSRPLLVAEVEWLRGGPIPARAQLVSDSSEDPRSRRLRALASFEAGDWLSVDDPEFAALREMGLLLDRVEKEPGSVREIAERAFEDPRASILASWLRGQSPRAWAPGAARTLDSDPAFQAWLDVLSAPGSAPHAPADLTPTMPYPLRLREVELQDAPLPGSFLLWSVSVGLRLRDQDSTDWDAALDASAPWFAPRKRQRFERAVAAGRWNEAHNLGFELVETSGAESDVALALIDVELRRGRSSIARGLWNELEPEAATTPAAELLHARVLLSEGEPKLAAERLGDLLRHDRLNVEALLIRAQAEAARNKWKSAERSLRQALDLEPDRLDARERLARQLMDRRLYERAAEEWERILHLTEDSDVNHSALFNLALSRQRNDEFAASLVVWARLLAAEPTDYKAHYNRALALEGLGRVPEAIAAYEDVLRLRPDHVGSNDKLATLTGRQGP